MINYELVRILKKSEAKYRYWRISKEERNFFPKEGVEFEVEFDGKTNILKITSNNLIMTGQFYQKYRFLENEKIILSKKKENRFVMKSPDTQLWPELK